MTDLNSETSSVFVDGKIFEAQSRGGISRLWTTLLKQFKLEGHKVHIECCIRSLKQPLPAEPEISAARRPLIGRLTNGWVTSVPRGQTKFLTYLQIGIGRGEKIVVCHDTMIEAAQPSLLSPRRLFIWLVYFNASTIVCISPKTMNEFSVYYPLFRGKTVQIYNPLNHTFLGFVPGRRSKVSGAGIRLLYVGARVGSKNFAAVKDLLDRDKRVTITVIGPEFSDSERREYSKWLESGRLIEKGAVPDDLYIVELRRADYLFLPSVDEGFGLPILEALSQEVPVLLFREELISWIVDSGYRVLLPKQVAEPISELSSPPGPAAMGAARQTVTRRFSPHVIAGAYLALMGRDAR